MAHSLVIPIAIVMMLSNSANPRTLSMPESLNAETLFVDDDSPDGGNGRSWPSAFRYLQDALLAARAPGSGVVEIRVARGTYKPDAGRGQVPRDKWATFALVSGTALRGGYAGIGAANPNERDIGAYFTILSGDLLNNDQPGFVNYTDNAYRVCTGVNLAPGTLLEGLRIQSSQMEIVEGLEGGGLYCLHGMLDIRSCTFADNLAYRGAGIGAAGVDIRILNCTFRKNRSGGGSGLYATTSDDKVACKLLLEESIFVDNTTHTAGDAAGVSFFSTEFGILRDCHFENNSADDGAALGLGGDVVIEDCVFRNNHADYSGAVDGSGTYIRCLFDSNTAAVRGGAWGEVTTIRELHARFVDCTFINNSTDVQGGGAVSGGLEFTNCRFIGNRAGENNGGPFAPGGAIHARVPASIINCEFLDNAAPGVGGAIAIPAGVPVTISNSTFLANRSEMSGHAVSGPAIICNSIFGPHEGLPLSGVSSVDYSCLPPAFPFAGGIGNIAADARFVDPLGPDGITGTEDDDLRLRADSPCIDAGDSTALPADQFDLDGDGDIAEPLPVDILGNRRVLFAPPHASPPDTGVPDASGAIIDMGAFEFRRAIDCAPATPPIGDGFVNIDDLLMVISGWGDCPKRPAPCFADVNADGAVNIDDLLAVVTGWG